MKRIAWMSSRLRAAMAGIFFASLGMAGIPALAAAAAPATATATATPRGTTMATATATASPEPFAARPLPGKRVADAALARQRGGTDTANNTVLKGSVADNQAINVTTGGNTIGGGAFAGAGGVPVVVQNSGNNVLIQSSVVVNVQLK